MLAGIAVHEGPVTIVPNMPLWTLPTLLCTLAAFRAQCGSCFPIMIAMHNCEGPYFRRGLSISTAPVSGPGAMSSTTDGSYLGLQHSNLKLYS